MLSASSEFRQWVAGGGRMLPRVTLALADGTVRDLAGDDIMQGGMSVDDSVSGGGSLQIGAAIANRLTLTLNNNDGRFDAYDFTGAVAVPYVGAPLPGGTEWLRKGVFGVEQPDSYGGTIGLAGIDNMRLLDVPYSRVATGYPATLLVIVTEACESCGVEPPQDFPNSSYVVPERPDDESLTCRSVVSYAAQAAGCWARMDEWGALQMGWFDLEADTAKEISAIGSLTVFTDDVVVTGLRVATDGGEPATYGADGYVLEVSGNPLVQAGEEQAVATLVGPRVVGLTFRPLTVNALGDPTLEAGDAIAVVDRLGRRYRSYATRASWRLGSRETYACEADSPGRNTAEGYSALTAAIVAQRKAIRAEKTAREVAVAQLAERLATSSGLHVTSEEQQDGSTVYYMHDKLTLAGSQIVWRLTAEALGMSTDGGESYPYGLDVSGAAVLERIYAVGIDASYINAGRVGDPAHGTYIDYATGDIVLGSATPFGDGTLGDALDDARRVATDFLTYRDGRFVLGVTGMPIRNVMTYERQAFETDAGEVMYFGRTDGIWKTFTPVMEVTDMLQFGGFAWIKRDNGNMTLKWIG